MIMYPSFIRTMKTLTIYSPACPNMALTIVVQLDLREIFLTFKRRIDEYILIKYITTRRIIDSIKPNFEAKYGRNTSTHYIPEFDILNTV